METDLDREQIIAILLVLFMMLSSVGYVLTF